tara:strand:- start:548 stop:1051 length:504 start_codon:yes stop_codon:yes gene_type:complete
MKVILYESVIYIIMIISCPSCNKKFEIDPSLIPDTGRTLKCGSCDYVWLYKKEENQLEFNEINISEKTDNLSQNIQAKKVKLDPSIKKSVKSSSQGSEIVKYESKSKFTFGKLLSYIMVLIITFVSLILILDTFKYPLFNFFPKLELFLFNFYETLKDVQLFIKDLF